MEQETPKMIPNIPEPPPPVPEHYYPKQKDYHVVTNIGPRNGRPLLPHGVALLDLPIAERKKYMWHVPKELHGHEMYDKHPDDFKFNPNKPKKPTEIETLTEHVTKLTNQLNELTVKIKTMSLVNA